MKTNNARELIAQIEINTAFAELENDVVENIAVEEVATTEVAPVVTVAVAVAATDTAGKKVPNSQKVRERIAIAKANNETHQDVIAWCMSELKQTKGLATRYVVENWDRDTTPKRGTCKLTVGRSVRGVAPRAVTNADRVRELIKAAKLANESKDAVVERAMQQLGQAKSVATKYVNDHWDRVAV